MPEVPELDRQHRAFIELLSRLDSAVEGGDPGASIDRVIDELIFHACFHFMFEERLMAEYGYPEMKAHQRKHQELIRNMARFKEKLESFGPGRFMEWFRRWPCAYLEAHIAYADKQVELHIRGHDSLTE